MSESRLVKTAVEEFLHAHAIAHENTSFQKQRRRSTGEVSAQIDAFDVDGAKTSIAAAHTALLRVEAAQERVLAFKANLSDNVLQKLVAIEDE